jgi:hypothetical protein
MKTRNLAGEMKSAFAAISRLDVAHLVGLGVSEILIEHFQMVGLARVRESRGGAFWEPDPDGRWAYITPVSVHYVDRPESTRPDAVWFFGRLVDLVAWDERNPERWRLRAGSNTWLSSVEPERMEPTPVPVWRSPLSWLRGRCVGLVPLTRDRSEIYQLLAICRGGIDTGDEHHAAWLREILDRPYPAPRVFSRRQERPHAA